MTEKELSQIHYINIEIRKITEELARLNNKSIIKGQEITGMPFVSGTSDKVADIATEKAELEMLLETNIKKLRAINDMGWREIGELVGMERTTVSKKYRNFLKVSHISRA